LNFSARDLQRRSGEIQDAALREPITITRNGRARLVMLSVEEYERLKRRDRRVFLAEELSEEEIAAIASAEPSPEAERHNHELEENP